MIDYFADRLIQAPLTPAERAALQSFLDGMPLVNQLPSVDDLVEQYRNKLRGLVHLLMTMPRYQLK